MHYYHLFLVVFMFIVSLVSGAPLVLPSVSEGLDTRVYDHSTQSTATFRHTHRDTSNIELGDPLDTTIVSTRVGAE